MPTFYISFKGEAADTGAGDRRHAFVADSHRTVTQWVEVRLGLTLGLN